MANKHHRRHQPSGLRPEQAIFTWLDRRNTLISTKDQILKPNRAGKDWRGFCSLLLSFGKKMAAAGSTRAKHCGCKRLIRALEFSAAHVMTLLFSRRRASTLSRQTSWWRLWLTWRPCATTTRSQSCAAAAKTNFRRPRAASSAWTSCATTAGTRTWDWGSPRLTGWVRGGGGGGGEGGEGGEEQVRGCGSELVTQRFRSWGRSRCVTRLERLHGRLHYWVRVLKVRRYVSHVGQCRSSETNTAVRLYSCEVFIGVFLTGFIR